MEALEKAKGARRPKSYERSQGRDQISTTVEEMSAGELETTGGAVCIRASNTRGLVFNLT